LVPVTALFFFVVSNSTAAAQTTKEVVEEQQEGALQDRLSFGVLALSAIRSG
jgi:hypothetical protein